MRKSRHSIRLEEILARPRAAADLHARAVGIHPQLLAGKAIVVLGPADFERAGESWAATWVIKSVELEEYDLF